jgi:hypothetical protein
MLKTLKAFLVWQSVKCVKLEYSVNCLLSWWTPCPWKKLCVGELIVNITKRRMYDLLHVVFSHSNLFLQPEVLDSALPEISVFCEVIRKYQSNENTYIERQLLMLAKLLDLGDEVGRTRLAALAST